MPKETEKKIDPSKYIDLEPELYGDKDDEDLEETVLTYTQRMKRGMLMRRQKAKMVIARRRAMKRRASPEKLKMKARKKALEILRNKLSVNKAYGDMTAPEKITLDQRLARIPKFVINRIATRQLPLVTRAETERMSQLNRAQANPPHIASGVNIKINESAEQFLSNRLNEKFELFMETSTPKKIYHKLYGIDGKVKHDKRFKIYRKRINESSDIFEEVFDLMSSVDEFISEGDALDRAKASIEREKTSDAIRHKNMIAAAHKTDAQARLSNSKSPVSSLRNESSSSVEKILEIEAEHERIRETLKTFKELAKKNDGKDIENWLGESTPSDREWGKKSLTKIYKRDTPGEKQ